MAICPNCGYRIEEGSRVCSACGEAVELVEDHIAESLEGSVFFGLLKAVEEEDGRAFWHIFLASEGLVFAKRKQEEGKLLIAEGAGAAVLAADAAGQSREIQAFLKKTPEQILDLEGDNFFISYAEIERVELRKVEFLKGPFFLTGLATIVTAQKIKDFYFPAEALDAVYHLFSSVMSGKTSMP